MKLPSKINNCLKSNKKVLYRIGNVVYYTFMTVATLFILRYLILFVAFDTFHTPTRSMTPTIPPDYTGLVNKLKMGGRIFDFMAAAEGRPFSVKRFPGYGKLERNDIIVFNTPWTNGWDSIAMNMRLYYCKRAIALAGDTLEVRDGHYRVRGYPHPLGVPAEQDMVKEYVAYKRRTTPDSIPMDGGVYAAPHDSLFNWTIDEMGPLVVPAKGMTIALDNRNLILYRKYIEWETGEKLPDNLPGTPSDSSADTSLPTYTFRENYCFAAGDHASDSQDSRYWGFLPEKFIVGTVPMPESLLSRFFSKLLIKFLRL